MAQHSDGQIKPEFVVVKDNHEGSKKVIKFLLSNGESISVTDNHGMLVYADNDCVGATNREQIIWANKVQINMKFRYFNRSNNQIELVKVVDIKNDISDGVYNVVGVNFNVVANNIVVSSHG